MLGLSRSTTADTKKSSTFFRNFRSSSMDSGVSTSKLAILPLNDLTTTPPALELLSFGGENRRLSFAESAKSFSKTSAADLYLSAFCSTLFGKTPLLTENFEKYFSKASDPVPHFESTTNITSIQTNCSMSDGGIQHTDFFQIAFQVHQKSQKAFAKPLSWSAAKTTGSMAGNRKRFSETLVGWSCRRVAISAPRPRYHEALSKWRAKRCTLQLPAGESQQKPFSKTENLLRKPQKSEKIFQNF